MPVPPTVDALDDRLLDAVYDPGTLARGRVYAEEGRASVLSSEPGLIKAVCRGSGPATYVVRVRWSRRDDGGDRVDVDDTCTCPIGRHCKHGVAVILTARREAAAAPAPLVDSPAVADWRRLFADLPTAEGVDDRWGTAGLALQFAVEHPTPTRYSTSTEPRVTVRPMRPGKAGQWIKTGASWRDISSPTGRPSPTSTRCSGRPSGRSWPPARPTSPTPTSRPRPSPCSGPISGSSWSGRSRSGSR